MFVFDCFQYGVFNGLLVRCFSISVFVLFFSGFVSVSHATQLDFVDVGAFLATDSSATHPPRQLRTWEFTSSENRVKYVPPRFSAILP